MQEVSKKITSFAVKVKDTIASKLKRKHKFQKKKKNKNKNKNKTAISAEEAHTSGEFPRASAKEAHTSRELPQGSDGPHVNKDSTAESPVAKKGKKNMKGGKKGGKKQKKQESKSIHLEHSVPQWLQGVCDSHGKLKAL